MNADLQQNLQYSMDPLGRVRFYGIYPGVVTDNNDPLKKNRLKIQVLQPTGGEVSNWAEACMPVTSISNHPDHQEHTASQIAALLTTSSVSASDPQGGSITIPALTVVAKAGAGTLKHTHKSDANSAQKWNDKAELALASTAEHTPHRLVPNIGQTVWVMFIAGDPDYPVWMGVKL